MRTGLVKATSTATGVASVMGSWQMCHQVCMGLLVVLGAMGITLTGMPLAFLTAIAKPLWLVAVALLGLSTWLYIKMRCIKRWLLVLNAGLIIAGVPFLPSLQAAWWIGGGSVALLGIFFLIKDRREKKERCDACA